jgi:membrane protease YdiL (CAAX protease family)
MPIAGILSRPAIASIFADSRGVHATWRIALFLLVAGIMEVLFGVAVHFGTHHFAVARFLLTTVPPIHPIVMAISEAVTILAVVIATLIMAWLEGVSISSYNLAPCRALPLLAGGIIFGVVALGLLVAMLLFTHTATLRFGSLTPLQNCRYGSEWLIASLLIGASEEFIFRAYLFSALSRGLSFRWAAVITSLLFGAAHLGNPHEPVIGLLTIVGFGAVLCITIWRTGSLWLAIGIHGGWDYAENYIFGSHDSGVDFFGTLLTLDPRGPNFLSGGATGPEGSIFCVLTLILMGLVTWRLFSPQREMAGD